MTSILLINKIFNSNEKNHIIISIILLGYFTSHKPVFAFVYLPILLSNIEFFKKKLIVFIGTLNLLIYYNKRGAVTTAPLSYYKYKNCLLQ